MRFILPLFLITFYSNMAWSDVYSTLTVMLGDDIIAQTSGFKKPEYCSYLAERLNRHEPIINKEGKLEKMHASCKYIHTTIPVPLFKPALENEEIFHKNAQKIFDLGPNDPDDKIIEIKEYYIQVALFDNEREARIIARKLNKKFTATLDGNPLKLVSQDYGVDKGVWWRVVTDFLENREKAESICAYIKSKGHGCIVRSKTTQFHFTSLEILKPYLSQIHF